MAQPPVGRGLAFGFGNETTWGTAVSRTIWVRGLSESMKRTLSYIPRGVLVEASGSRNIRSTFLASDMAGGTLEFLVGYEGMGRILQHILHGTPTTTGPVSSIYTHTYLLATSPPTGGLTIEVIRGNSGISEVFEGCR